jgi:hypothetical protein
MLLNFDEKKLQKAAWEARVRFGGRINAGFLGPLSVEFGIMAVRRECMRGPMRDEERTPVRGDCMRVRQ